MSMFMVNGKALSILPPFFPARSKHRCAAAYLLRPQTVLFGRIKITRIPPTFTPKETPISINV